MNPIHLEWFAILAVALASALGAASVARVVGYDRAQARRERAGRRPPFVAHRFFDTWAFVALSPVIAIVGLVFFATLVPLVFMVPFFVVWAARTHEEHKRQLAQRAT